MDTGKKHKKIEQEPRLPVDFPVEQTSSYAHRARILRAMRHIAAVTKHAREASAEMGISKSVAEIIEKAEAANREAIERLELVNETVGNGKK